MKSGLLYRSDELSHLTRQDGEKLLGLGLKLIIDLRASRQTTTKPARLPAGHGIRVTNIPITFQAADVGPSQFMAFINNKASGFDYENYMMRYYHEIIFESQAQIEQIFALLACAENLPALIHCTAGKDRTGLVTALIQCAAGVPRSLVIEDFLATNQCTEASIKHFTRILRLMSLFRASPERIRQVMEVRPEYLNHILDEIDDRCGGIEAYLTNFCRIPIESLHSLCRLLT